jgi:serine/threonine protein kinase
VSEKHATKTVRDDLAPTALAPTVDDAHDAREARDAPKTIAQRTIGRFRIDEPLGSGGMADVYRAYDPTLDRAIALKVLRTKRDADAPERMRRVLREARAAAALTHPNTVTIFEVGEADGEVFIAMELLEGAVLRALLARGDATLPQKLRWLLAAARALAAAHERGLVHRDVKPDNMFVSTDGTLKLLDFGIAKREEDDTETESGAPGSMGPSSMRTAEGRRIGTPRYMAPEQHAGLTTDARTDEYAWGLVAFEMLTGTHPVGAQSTMADTDGVSRTSTRIADLRAIHPELSEPVANAIARALEPVKEHRFPTMAPIIAALEASDDRAASMPPRSAPATPSNASSVAPPPSPAIASRGGRMKAAGVGVLLAIATLGAVRVFSRARLGPGTAGGTSERGAAVPAPGCRVEFKSTVPITQNDRATILPDGSIVTAHDIDKKLVFERETPSGRVPFHAARPLASLEPTYQEVALSGIRFGGAPAILSVVSQGPVNGTLVALWTDGPNYSMSRIPGMLTGLAVTAFGDDAVALATMLTNDTPGAEPGGPELYLITKRGMRHTLVEDGAAWFPSLATSEDRIALAYFLHGTLRFAMLDRKMQRLGDVLTVANAEAAPAVAFVGGAVAVLWIDASAKSRLVVSTYTPGETAFSPSKIAIDEPVVRQAPVVAPLPSGASAVAWLASTGGRTKVRVSPLGAGGTLTGPTDVDDGVAISGLRATAGDHGIHLTWLEGTSAVKIARVTCP